MPANPVDPTQSFFNSYQQGLALHDRQIAQQAAQQQAQAQAERQKALQQDLANINASPSPSKIASLSVKYPELSEQFKRSFDMMTTDQRDQKTKQLLPIYAAILNGDNQTAADSLRTIAEAQKNSGMDKDAEGTLTFAQTVEQHPEQAKTLGGLTLANLMGPDKFTETFTKLQTEQRDAAEEPAKLSEAESKAKSAAVTAKFAESNAAMDLQKKGWDITKIRSDIDIAKKNANIAALNAQIARETNGLKRQELGMQLTKMQLDRDNTLNAKTADLESARNGIDNMLSTADKVLKTPMGTVGSAAGPISSRAPTFSQDTADFEELINTLGSQAFIAQVPAMKGLGALSDAEGKKLTSALQNFSLRQSPERLMQNVQEAQRLMLKARENIAKKNGMPDTLPDRPQAPVQGMPAGFSVVR
jgi:hypothetical protein